MTCKKCPIENYYWSELHSNKSIQTDILRMYYHHEFSPTCLSPSLKLCSPTPLEASELLLELIYSYSVAEIINILKCDFTPYVIEAKDIPQFSNFDVCYYDVVQSIVRSGYSSVNYDQLGFFLRKSPRKIGADRKYGENHAKTAALMGLCVVQKGIGISVTPIGKIFSQLSREKQNNLKAKMCLYIPLMQNIFVQGCTQEIVNSSLAVLSPTTKKRRHPNIKYIQLLIQESINYELYRH